jgi:sorting nexin-29
MIQAGGNTLRSEIQRFINSIWNKEEFPQQWKEFTIVPPRIYKTCNKIDCSNYRGISLLQTTYKILPSSLLSRLIPYVEGKSGDHMCGFRRNRSNTYPTFCISQILGKMRVQYINNIKISRNPTTQERL